MQGGGGLPAQRPTGGLQGDRRRPQPRLWALHRAQRACSARGARSACTSAYLRWARAHRRRAPLRGGQDARHRSKPCAGAPAGAVVDSQRDRGGDAPYERRDLASDKPAGRCLSAVARHRHDPPHRGARFAAPGGDGRSYHLDRRRLQAAHQLRHARGSRACELGRRIPQRATRRLRARCTDALQAPG